MNEATTRKQNAKSCPASVQMNEKREKERDDKNTPQKLLATGPWGLIRDGIGKFHFVISWNYRIVFPLPVCFGRENFESDRFRALVPNNTVTGK